MSNQPPARPWFRLASIRSIPPSSAPAAPEPRPPPTIPTTFRNINLTRSQPAPPPPSAPVPRAVAAPPPPAPAPRPFVPAAPSVPSPTTRAAQPQTTSPDKITAIPPPSPQALPRTQLRTRSEVEPRIPTEEEAEPKIVVVQKSIEKSTTKNDEFQREPGIRHKKISDLKDSDLRVITLAGENRGAYMEISRSSKKHESKILHKNGGTKTNSSGGESEGSTNEDGKAAGDKDKKGWKGRTVSSSFPMTAFVNSNVQSVNNSIMSDASCEHNDPGVHLVLTKKPAGNGLSLKERVSGQHN